MKLNHKKQQDLIKLYYQKWFLLLGSLLNKKISRQECFKETEKISKKIDLLFAQQFNEAWELKNGKLSKRKGYKVPEETRKSLSKEKQ